MAGPKARIPAPIDRPLSRAYLREFSGWSTAYPPGLSDPTSLRVMDNVMVNRDGSLRVRPGLRYLSYASAPSESGVGFAPAEQLVGTHEAFFLNDGSKAYLFAVREDDGSVGFRVLQLDTAGSVIRRLTDTGIDFDLPGGESSVNFSAATTYVKYLQIDNKIFALSNAGEPMRLFHVGSAKLAKAISAITRPDWTLGDKLTVVHPDAAWVTNAAMVSYRYNLLKNPSFETNVNGWDFGALTGTARPSGDPVPWSGDHSLRLESLPTRTNLMTSPLHDVGNFYVGLAHWGAGTGGPSLEPSGTWMAVHSDSGGGLFYATSPRCKGVEAGKKYRIAYDTKTDVGGNTTPKCRVRFFGSTGAQVGGDTTYTLPTANTRWVSPALTAPDGAVSVAVHIGGNNNSSLRTYAYAKNVLVCLDGEATDALNGSDTGFGAIVWTGDANNSSTVYHPPTQIRATSDKVPVSAGSSVSGSLYLQADSIAATPSLTLRFYDADGNPTGSEAMASPPDDWTIGWLRYEVGTTTPPAGSTQAALELILDDVGRAEYHFVDGAMIEPDTDVAGAYFDGSTASTDTVIHSWDGAEQGSRSSEATYSTSLGAPGPEAKTVDTLISSEKAKNVYQFGFFYTFSNDVGESAASQITVVRTQRGWSAWRWETPNASGEPSGTDTADPTQSADQLIATIPTGVFAEAIAQGATSWNLYMFTWSDQEPVPVTALRIGTKTLGPDSEHSARGWIRTTPVVSEVGSDIAVLPKAGNRYNYSDPSRGGNGIVAADRMVVVNDPTAAAVIRWSSNQQGDYSNFTASKGGGYKTLTSGNLYVPAAVKLWQNPQSVDTLTILCVGTDGRSTGYYMAPAQVASQSEATNIMGFEETTATPGTTSPYGCEVFNNALYHPLDDQLMKSTATNYNINHKSQTDQIRNVWERLSTKQWIISAQHDSRLYYIVNNPAGAPLEAGCHGNEIWVFDAGGDKGSWSRFTVQATSLRKIEFGGRVYMSVVRPDGIYYLDPDYALDDYVGDDDSVLSRAIPWSFETNTQGANRAHDAWAHLQQVNITLGNFLGVMRYGIRSFDIHGRAVEYAKIVRDDAPADQLTWDLDDFLAVRNDLQQWFFFAESVTSDTGEVEQSFGQLNLVQYRYTPSTVNTGYEYGSIETFEYGRAATGVESITTNGTPRPMIDTRRP